MKQSGITWVAVACLSLSCIVLASGCGATTQPTSASGVLSTIHQKSLTLACERALAQAQIDSANYGKSKVQLQLDVNENSPDLAKGHVRNVIVEHFRNVSAGVVDSGGSDCHKVVCKITLAGIDNNIGEFMFWRWIDTKAEVQLKIKDEGTTPATEKNGAATAKYAQVWFMNIGPSEELK